MTPLTDTDALARLADDGCPHHPDAPDTLPLATPARRGKAVPRALAVTALLAAAAAAGGCRVSAEAGRPQPAYYFDAAAGEPK